MIGNERLGGSTVGGSEVKVTVSLPREVVSTIERISVARTMGVKPSLLKIMETKDRMANDDALRAKRILAGEKPITGIAEIVLAVFEVKKDKSKKK